MKFLTWQNPEQLFVAQELINKVKSKCCGIKVNVLLGIPLLLIITIVCVFFIGLVPRERNKVLSYIKDRI